MRILLPNGISVVRVAKSALFLPFLKESDVDRYAANDVVLIILSKPAKSEREKKKTIHTVELLMSIATLGAPLTQILSIAFDWNYIPVGARFTGFCTGILGDLIFLASVICMRDSWRAGIPCKDKTELVTGGIYKFSRNPAFLGFDFMYIGVLLMYFNPLTLLFSLFAIAMLHLQILQEEKYLTATFGKEYEEYRKLVFRYLGRK